MNYIIFWDWFFRIFALLFFSFCGSILAFSTYNKFKKRKQLFSAIFDLIVGIIIIVFAIFCIYFKSHFRLKHEGIIKVCSVCGQDYRPKL